jgi:hypothetical protein
LVGAVQLNVNDTFPVDAMESVGAPGAAIGVADCAGLEAALSPLEFTAVTMK